MNRPKIDDCKAWRLETCRPKLNLKGVFKCMLKALRVWGRMVRHVSQPPFLVQPGGRQQGGIVATVCKNAEPRYQNPAQEKELPARNQLDNEMNEEKAHGVYPSIPVPRPQEDSLTLWTTSPWVFSEICRLCRSNSTSVILQGSVWCPPRQFNPSWKPGYLRWIQSQTLSGIHSLLSTSFKKHSST